MSDDKSIISTEKYKGVRDFYPQNARKQNYLFSTMRATCQRFGYEEINSSVLEPAALYDAKSGNELANEQSYRFEDRGGREVMLRPEMTPTTARMIAARHKAMSFPVRWFSIPNVFRYEQPQHGRLREHWQLNADIFGIYTPLADTEIISLAHQTLTAFGAKEGDFVIKINSRGLFREFCSQKLAVDSQTQQKLIRLTDKKDKLGGDEFSQALTNVLDEKQAQKLQKFLSIDSLDDLADHYDQVPAAVETLQTVFSLLAERNITNAVFAPDLVRGLDYYTGVVFEIFDTSPDNPRSICGGGRYDSLMEIFDAEPIPAVGFGLGDVTLADFLTTHDLWPDLKSATDMVIVLVDPSEHAQYGHEVAHRLRDAGLNVAVDISGANVGTQIKQADQSGADKVMIIGDDEVDNETITIKTLKTGDETTKKLKAVA